MTEKTKHTPGPWVAVYSKDRVFYNGHDISYYVIYTDKTRHQLRQEGNEHYSDDQDDVDNIRIADAYYNDMTTEEAIANASLIAAAPDLLKILKELSSECMEIVAYKDWPELQALVDKAQDIIARAEGDQ